MIIIFLVTLPKKQSPILLKSDIFHDVVYFTMVISNRKMAYKLITIVKNNLHKNSSKY